MSSNWLHPPKVLRNLPKKWHKCCNQWWPQTLEVFLQATYDRRLLLGSKNSAIYSTASELRSLFWLEFLRTAGWVAPPLFDGLLNGTVEWPRQGHPKRLVCSCLQTGSEAHPWKVIVASMLTLKPLLAANQTPEWNIRIRLAMGNDACGKRQWGMGVIVLRTCISILRSSAEGSLDYTAVSLLHGSHKPGFVFSHQLQDV